MHNKDCKRLPTFDILKGVGIILVILGHLLGNGFGMNIISQFHMPLFFLISGYFFKSKTLKYSLSENFEG